MKGLAVALGGVLVAAALAIGLTSTAHAAAGRAHPATATGHPQSMSNPTTTSASYVGCSASEQSELGTAAQGAQQYAGSAAAYLGSHSSATPRYTTWFGAFTAARHNTVVDHFQKISQTQFAGLTYDCSTCRQPGFGSTDASDHVVLCQSFWQAPMTGTDSKSGTLVNLVGRFPRNGGLKDSVKGQEGCRTLATDNPDSAAQNAASYEYFAENRPPLA